MASDRPCVLVIVGAGASYDCLRLDDDEVVHPAGGGPGHPWAWVRPPLTRDLVAGNPFRDGVLARYPQVGGVAAEIRKRLALAAGLDATTLESVLGQLASRQARDPRVAIRLLAFQYYLRDLFLESVSYVMGASGRLTNYTSLVRAAQDWATDEDGEVCFVTFNYDLLLDLAFQAETAFKPGIDFTTREDGRLSLLRPHGCAAWEWGTDDTTNWGGSKSSIAQQLLAEGQIPDFNKGRVHFDDRSPQDDYAGTGRRSMPVMALPLPGKSQETLVWPPGQQEHLEQRLRARVTKLVVLGWRAADEHFTPLLAPAVQITAPKLIITGDERGPDCAEGEAAAIAKRLCDIGDRDADAQTYTEGFSQLVRTDALEEFLRS